VSSGGWPPGVEPITVDDLRRLGIDRHNQLFWDGRRVEIRRPLVLTGFQKTVAVIVTLCAVLGGFGGFVSGLNNAAIFLCGRGIGWLGCPPPVIPPEPWGR
jgi:hypothetical protein